MKKLMSLVLVLCMVLGMSVSVFAEGTVKEVATLGDLAAAIEAAGNGDTIKLTAAITGDVTVVQKPDVNFTIDGNNNTFNGVITINGKSSRYETAGVTIKNVNFNATSPSADAYINLGKAGDNNTRYTNNVTVSNCTFSGNIVAVKSYTGGDWNLTIENCTVNEGMHSLAQLSNVEKGLVISGCKVYSERGINLNNTPSLTMSGCTFDVQKYAVRVGVDDGKTNIDTKNFTITDSTLKSDCADGDSVIIIRDNATNTTLTMTETAVSGTSHIAGATDNTIISVDENQEIVVNKDGSIVIVTESPVVDEPIIIEREETYKTVIESSENGSVKADSKKVTRGEKVTLTVTPDKGYELAALLVIDEDGNERKVTENEDGTFSFRMPEGGVTVEAEFVKIGAAATAPSTEKENPSTGAADFVGAAAALAVVSVMGMAALSIKR